MQTIREINSNIFPRLYTFSGTYPKSFTIFGPLHNSIFKFKYQTFLNKKEKEKGHYATLAARWNPAQVGPRVLSRADRARALSHAATDGRVPPVRGVFNLPPPLR